MARVSAEERRRQLVAAAFRVIGRDGFAGVTTRRVCAEAGAPLAAFHYCFASKQELLAELTTQTMAALMSAQHEMPLRETVEATLRAELRGYWRTVEDDPNRESVLMALTQHALHDRVARRRGPAPVRRLPRHRPRHAAAHRQRASGSRGRCRWRTWRGCSSSSPTA